MSICLLFHDWGPWESEEPSSPCREKRECLRCGEKEHRENHDWGEWTSKPGFESCSRERNCKRCGKIDTEDMHSYPATEQICSTCDKQLDSFMNC